MTSDRDTLREAVRAEVEAAMNSAIPEPWEVADNTTARILALIPLSEVEEVLGRFVIGYGRDHTSKFCRDQALALLSKLKALRGEPA